MALSAESVEIPTIVAVNNSLQDGVPVAKRKNQPQPILFFTAANSHSKRLLR